MTDTSAPAVEPVPTKKQIKARFAALGMRILNGILGIFIAIGAPSTSSTCARSAGGKDGRRQPLRSTRK